MVSFLIAYASWSGNTEEVAEIVEETLLAEGMDVVAHRIGMAPLPNPREFDAMIIGSFTWDKGATPDEVKDFVADIGYKPETCLRFWNRGYAVWRGRAFLRSGRKARPILRIENMSL